MGRGIISGEYCGPIEHLKGERAILMNCDRHTLVEDDDRPVLAQFDNREAKLGGTWLGYCWHPFKHEDFYNFNFNIFEKS